MTSHAPPIDVSHDQPPLPNEYFSSWLRGQTTLFVSQIVAILGSISLIASTIYYVYHLGGHEGGVPLLTVRLIVDYAHLAFISVFILVLIRFLDDNERGSYRVKLVYRRVFKEPKPGEKNIEDVLETGKTQLRTFKRRFLWFWIGMLCLYVCFAWQHTHQAKSEPVKAHAPSKDYSLTVAGRIPGKEEGFKEKYSVSITEESHAAESKPQVPEKGAGGVDEEKEKVRKKLNFSFLTFFFNNFTLLFVFWCFLVMYIRPDETERKGWKYIVKRKEWKYIVGSVVVVALLTFLFLLFRYLKEDEFTVKSADGYSAIFDALSGVVNAVVLALLIARLDSKLVGLPPWLISILYSYAAVQPLFLVFELSGESKLLEAIGTLVLIFVFVSKIYFFLIIFYALQTGKMLNYLSCFPILRERADLPDLREPAGEQGETASERAPVFDRLRTFALLLFERLRAFGSLSLRKPAKRRLRASRKRAHLTVRDRRVPPPGVRERLALTASRLLRSRYSLWVGEVVGWAAILYFFASMIGSQVIPKTRGWGGDIWGDPVGLAVTILRPPDAVATAIGFAQLAAVSVMMILLLLVLKDNGYGSKLASGSAWSIFNEPLEHGHPMEQGEAQLKKFKKYFLYFWFVTFLLYVVFLPPLRLEPKIIYGSYLEGTAAEVLGLLFYPSLEFVLSSLNLMCAFWCYVVLRAPPPAKPSDATPQRSDVTRKRLDARQKRFEARQKLLVNYSGFAVLLLIAVYPLLLVITGRPSAVSATENAKNLSNYATVFYGVTGLLSAVVLALLIARMDSKLFNLPSRLIWMLFAYASIQSLFIAFAQDDDVLQTVRAAVLTAALGLKICFFLIVAHSLQSGRMLNYLVCFPLLKERVDSIFENQFEIRLARAEDNEFTFSILKKNRLHYSTAMTFESRDKCDKAIEELRELMVKGDPYGSPRQASGTYWVEVRSAKGLWCESIPLRSEEEALDLIDESIGKVPYCKYNRL